MKVLASNLKYPGKLICIEKTEYFPYEESILVVSDSGNNRVLIFDEETKECMDVIGNSQVGLVDGSYEETSFHYPQVEICFLRIRAYVICIEIMSTSYMFVIQKTIQLERLTYQLEKCSQLLAQEKRAQINKEIKTQKYSSLPVLGI